MSEQQTRQLRDPGGYVGDLIEGVFSIAETGTPQMVLRFELQQGGGSAYVFLFLTDKAMEYSSKDLQKLGFGGKFDAPTFTNTTDIPLVCKHEEYQSKTREKWSLGGGWMPQPADASDAGQMNAKWRAMFGAQPTRKPTTPTQQKAPAPPPDDVNNETFEREDGVTHTKASAWTAWTEAQNPPDVKRWKSVVAAVGKGKPEAEFTGDMWAAVANKAVPI